MLCNTGLIICIANKTSKSLAKVKQICYFSINDSLKFIQLFEEYLIDYDEKYGDKPDSFTKLVKMIINAYTFSITNSTIILLEIDPNFEKKIKKLINKNSTTHSSNHIVSSDVH